MRLANCYYHNQTVASLNFATTVGSTSTLELLSRPSDGSQTKCRPTPARLRLHETTYCDSSLAPAVALVQATALEMEIMPGHDMSKETAKSSRRADGVHCRRRLTTLHTCLIALTRLHQSSLVESNGGRVTSKMTTVFISACSCATSPALAPVKVMISTDGNKSQAVSPAACLNNTRVR